MSEQTAGAQSAPNPIELSQNLMRMSLLSQQFYGKWLSQQLQQRKTLPMDDSLGLGRAFSQLAMSLAANPAALAGTQVSFWQDAFSLWQQAGMRMFGANSESVIQPARDDRRFKDEAWQDNPL
ncbi:MAG: hypothetical protein PHF72_01380, partial [Gammaproteobacteria bacterium]|nr:hypothetical protein [Gammaproteobacteria bacterium]